MFSELTERVNYMEQSIEKMLKIDGILTVEACLKIGLKEYDPSLYHELEILGVGSFGIVKKCKYLPNHEFHAIKILKIQGFLSWKRNKFIIEKCRMQ